MIPVKRGSSARIASAAGRAGVSESDRPSESSVSVSTPQRTVKR